MARYVGRVEARHGAEEVWRYLADLRSIREWDPSVEIVTLVGGDPLTEGARYELELGFRGRIIKLPYRVVEAEPPHRVVFAAETESLHVRDEALIEPSESGTSTVTWKAELRLRGLRRFLGLPLRVVFKRLGQDAERGLGERLRRPVLEFSREQVAG